MLYIIKSLLITIPILAILDLLWVGVVMKPFYWSRLGHLLADSVLWAPVVGFYLVFSTGILYFAVFPALQNTGSLIQAGISGALLGLVAYGTYNFTNNATLMQWPVSVTLLDIAWGTLLGALVAICVTFLLR